MAERRSDPTNPKGSKKTYTREQFVEFYGPKHAAKMWKQGASGSDPSERRRDPTNPPEAKKTYTRDQFIEFYGKADGAKMWNRAPKVKAAKKEQPKKAAAKKEKKDAAPKPKQEITVGYWGIRGLAGPLRMMCFYRGANLNDKLYTDGDDWFKTDKPALLEKNALMNLPYVQIGTTVVNQSNACLQFLGKRLGIDRGDSTLNDQALCEIYDLRNDMVGIIYPGKKGVKKEDFKAAALKHLETVGGSYTKLNNFAKGDYLTGKKPRSADFHLWEMLDQHETLAKWAGQESPLAKFDKLKAIHEGMRKLPQLEKYFESEAFKLPFNHPAFANWTGLE